MSRVIDVFPRRPLKLARVPGRKSGRIALLVMAALLALPALYWGNIAWQREALRQDLRARGVRADRVLDAEGDCYSRRNRLSGRERPQGCWLTITYRLRPEEGGGTRTAETYLDGDMPIFTPPALYDPRDPGRAMLEPEVEREMTGSELLGPIVLLLLPLIALAIWFFTGRRGLAKAAAHPQPTVVPIEKVIAHPGRLYIHTRPPGAPRVSVDSFAPPAGPLLVRPPQGSPDGQQWVLALLSPGGRAYALDDRLALLELTDDEQRAVLDAARG